VEGGEEGALGAGRGVGGLVLLVVVVRVGWGGIGGWRWLLGGGGEGGVPEGVGLGGWLSGVGWGGEGERTSWGKRVGRENMVGRCRWILFLASMAPGSSKLYERLTAEDVYILVFEAWQTWSMHVTPLSDKVSATRTLLVCPHPKSPCRADNGVKHDVMTYQCANFARVQHTIH